MPRREGSPQIPGLLEGLEDFASSLEPGESIEIRCAQAETFWYLTVEIHYADGSTQKLQASPSGWCIARDYVVIAG